MKTNKNQARGLAKVSHLFLSGPEPSKEKVTIQMAAKMLNVSKGTVVTYLNKGVLTRIKERGSIYIARDEVTELHDSGRKHLVTYGSSDSESRTEDSKQKGSCSQPHTELRQLKGAGQDVPGKGPASKHKEIEFLEAEIFRLKQNLAAQATKLEGVKSVLERLGKKQQRELADFSKATETEEEEIEKTQARLLAVEERLQGLRRSWWKRVFSDL